MHHYEDIEADDYYDMGVAWAQQNDLVRAEECLRHAIDCNPHFTHAYIELAAVLALRLDYHGAVHVLREGAYRDRNFDRLHYLMAKYAYKEGDLRNAQKFIGRAIDLNPDELYLRVREIIERKYRQKRH